MHLWYFSCFVCFDCHVDVDNVQHHKLISFYRGIVLYNFYRGIVLSLV